MDTRKFRFSYNDRKDALEYIESCEGKDSRFLIEILKRNLRSNSTVLELGMGPGCDLDLLSETFQTTGSDYSQTFLDIYREKNPSADLLLLDAVSIKTNRKFDCIYSNKVLHHLTRNDLKKSLSKQKELLNENGILFHTFWNGERQKESHGLRFIQYKLDELQDYVSKSFEIIEIDFYKEMNLNDSIFLILLPK